MICRTLGLGDDHLPEEVCGVDAPGLHVDGRVLRAEEVAAQLEVGRTRRLELVSGHGLKRKSRRVKKKLIISGRFLGSPGRG